MKEYKFNGRLRPSSVLIDNQEFYHLYEQQFHSPDRSTACEIIIRLPDPRADWIEKWYKAARRYERAGAFIIKHCQQTCFVIPAHDVYDAASSAPRHGDKYDYKTGVAVAFAKAFGQPIPDYI